MTKIVFLILFLLLICVDLYGQKTKAELYVLKSSTGLREGGVIEMDSNLVYSVLDHIRVSGSDTIPIFLHRTYGYLNNSDGYAHGFSGEIKGLLIKELLKEKRYVSVVFENFDFKLLYPESEFDSYADYFYDYPALYISVRDSTEFFPLLRAYILEEQPDFSHLLNRSEKFTKGFQRWLFLLRRSFSNDEFAALPTAYQDYWNAITPTAEKYEWMLRHIRISQIRDYDKH